MSDTQILNRNLDARVVVGDFSYPTGNLLSRMFKKLYWYMAVFIFWLFANNASHKIYNYPEHMQRVGFLKKYGTHSQSFSTLQPGMQYFDVPGVGYIAYMRKWGENFKTYCCHKRSIPALEFLAMFKLTRLL